MAQTLTFTSAPFYQVTQFTSAGGTAASTILTVDNTNARRVYSIGVWTDESASAKDVSVHLDNGTTAYELTTISIPLSSGNTNAIVPVDILTHTQMAPFVKQRDASGAPYLNIPTGYSLKLNYNTALASGKLANVIVSGETYA
jgi:hypothetical protein